MLVLIPTEHWITHAGTALRFLCSIWGGIGGAVLPVDADGDVPAALLPALRHFDPDYVTRLGATASEYEEIYPGRISVPPMEGGRERSDTERRHFLRAISGPVVDLVGQAAAMRVASLISPFTEDGGFSRVDVVHPEQQPVRPLTPVKPVGGICGTTGEPLIDLSLFARCGSSPIEARPSQLYDLEGLTGWECWRQLFAEDGCPEGASSAFISTAEDLTEVTTGYVSRGRARSVVLGDTSADFGLAMLVGRGGVEHIPWLPTAAIRDIDRAAVGSALTQFTSYGRRKLRVMSTSQSAEEAQESLKDLYATRPFKVLQDPGLEVQPVLPGDWRSEGRTIWGVKGAWDVRGTITASVDDAGGAEMLAAPLHQPPFDVAEADRTWIVEHWRLDHQLPSRLAVSGRTLLAAGQNPHETFVRAAEGSIAYESSRWDFVSAGASVYGQLASPRLRWPSLRDTLTVIAMSHGCTLRASDAGRRAAFVISLWGSREMLARDLTGVARELLEAFRPGKKVSNGPYTFGIARHGVGYVTFSALLAIATSGGWTDDELRHWLDERIVSGAVTRGLILGCEACTWVHFYPLEALGQGFKCQRCGAPNRLVQARWRRPEAEPDWYYDVHPNVTQLLQNDGDLPLLAVERYLKAVTRPGPALYEFELVPLETGKPTVEVDFALLDGARLVIGEAKKGRTLDGKNEKEKRRDAAKLANAADWLEADELCLASASTWAADTWPLLRAALRRNDRTVLARLEGVQAADARPERPSD